MKFVLIGKCFSNEINGPGPVMMALKQILERQYPEESNVIFWNEENNKLHFMIAVIKQLCSKEQCVINVHTSGLLIPTVILLLSKIFRKHKYYMTLHGIYEIETLYTGKRSKRNAYLEKKLCQNFPNIICVSKQQQADIKRIYGRSDCVQVIPNGTDACNFICKEELSYKDTIEVVTLGGLKERKGINHTLELMKFLVHEKEMNVHLSIYGSEEGVHTSEWLLNWCAENKLSHHITYHGLIREKKMVYSTVEKSHFQLCLSGYDTFNIAIAESLVLGCPCICSDRCGASYLIEKDENGIVINWSDETWKSEIYNFMISFIADEEKYRKILKKSEKYKVELSWDDITRQYIRLTLVS